jgi:hypothetical protein
MTLILLVLEMPNARAIGCVAVVWSDVKPTGTACCCNTSPQQDGCGQSPRRASWGGKCGGRLKSNSKRAALCVKAVRRGPNPWSNNLDTPAIVKSGARAAASLLLPRCVNIRAAAAAARPPPPPLLLLLLLLLLLRPPCRSRCGARRGRRPLGRSHRRDGERCRDGGARILQIMRQVLPAACKHKVPGGRGPLRELVRATAPRCCMRGAALRRSEAAPPCCAAASPSLPRLPPPAAPAPTQ